MHNGVHICNPYVPSMDVDVLYHVGLATDTTDLKKQFGDVKVSLTYSSVNTTFN